MTTRHRVTHQGIAWICPRPDRQRRGNYMVIDVLMPAVVAHAKREEVSGELEQ